MCPKRFDPNIDNYLEFLRTLQQQWRVCKSLTMGHVAREFQATFKIDISQFDSSTTKAIQSSSNCSLLCKQEVCIHCNSVLAIINKRLHQRKKQPNKRKTNIKFLTKQQAQQCVRESRRALMLQKRKTARLRRILAKLIEKKGVSLPDSDNKDFLEILSGGRGNDVPGITDLTELFFQEQLKAAKSKSSNGHRWHPLMLKWCLYLKTKSSSTYSAMRKVLTLPSEKTLYAIQAHTHIKPGFQADVLSSLETEFSNAGPEGYKRYCTLLYDEMKIQEDLVYKTSTNELIGFIQLSSIDQLLSEIEAEVHGTRKNEELLASHVLQLMVRGVTSSICSSFAYFATKTLTARNLHSILWEAVEILERKDIRVLGFVSDGAACNRAFYKMSSDPTTDCWYTVNPYAPDRNIYFICDVPHLLKTVRNCVSNSGSHKKTRLLWKNGKHIEWAHIVEAYKGDLCEGIRRLSHITDEHVHLTPCSLMKVRLAAQVLSRRMAVVLKSQQSEDLTETIKLVETFNKWFDICNTRNLFEGRFSRNNDLNPFRQLDDERLTWLEVDFIQYLQEWEDDVMQRPGGFTKTERAKMLLSKETIQGLQITAHSIAAIVKFMLKEGSPFVLTNKLNQDPVELHFSIQRGAGGCNTNPNLMRYGDNSAKLKSMRVAKQDVTFFGKGNVTL